MTIAYTIALSQNDAEIQIQSSSDLTPGSWTDLAMWMIVPDGGNTGIEATIPRGAQRTFFRVNPRPRS
jgi:hypothetical protein